MDDIIRTRILSEFFQTIVFENTLADSPVIETMWQQGEITPDDFYETVRKRLLDEPMRWTAPRGVIYTPHYNKMPGPTEQITKDEYISLFYSNTYIHQHSEFRQVFPDELPMARPISVHIFWFPFYGLAVGKYPDAKNNEHFEFIYIGCRHEWGQRENLGNFDKQQICYTCGATHTYNSS